MKRIAVLIVAVVVIVVLWLVFGSNSDNQSDNQTSTTNNSSQKSSQSTQSNTQNSPANQSTATSSVTIQDMTFTPANITVKQGTAVTWTNKDAIAHTVTENDGKNGPSGPPLDQGQSYSFTFKETGVFHYHCSIHPEMTGTVTVTSS